MLLKDLLRKPIHNYLYLERYVNKGSPSGYTRRYTTSDPYDPIKGSSTYLLPCFKILSSAIDIFGDRSNIYLKRFTKGDQILFPVHPDMVYVFHEIHSIKYFSPQYLETHLTVSPTANGRTVFCHENDENVFIKLHYEGIIGRVMRGLPRAKAIAGVEINNDLCNAYSLNQPPKRMAILREIVALILSTNSPSLIEIGVVLRETRAFPEKHSTVLIPFFSLFSRDIHNPNHPDMLTQILREQSNPEEVLFNDILKPLLESYCFLIFKRGILPEINAQNVLLEIDTKGNPTRIVLRDFQGYEKDLTRRKLLGLASNFHSYPYKCISREEDEDIYYIRHSFSYDFKLGRYVFDEILNSYCKEFSSDKIVLSKRIADIFHEIANGEEIGHFKPENLYFYHKNELLTQQRRYFSSSPPLFRKISSDSGS